MLIRRAEVDGQAPLDVRIDGERIIAVERGLSPSPGEVVIDACGGALLPGLHDHHIHLLALAAAERSVRCGPPHVRSEDELVAALRAAAEREPAEAVIRGVGYHESVAGELDRHVLDRWLPGRAVQIQQRTGALWVVSSAWIERFGVDDPSRGHPPLERDVERRTTGRLYRLDGWVRTLGRPRGAPPSLEAVGVRAARFGVTGLTDATLGNALKELRILERAVRVGELKQRLVVMGWERLPTPRLPGVSLGSVKLVLDEAELFFEAAVSAARVAHARGRTVAIHAVTRTEVVFAAEVFREAGVIPGDRLEHASVAPPEVAALVAELGLTVVTQPHFVRERGDAYRTDVELRDQPWLYRCRGWDALQVPLGGGTDAPFGEPDPWLAMQAAVDRRTESGHVIGPGEALTPERALALFTTPAARPGGTPRRIAPGELADLCLLDRPWRLARARLASEDVRATILGGLVTWDREAGS
ncbi:MAG: amidohydrolase family protein [Deltaproteobacteria bacterium]|nr:amidohydrolase family protein [Deltaproteobacteria bacterium]